MSPKGGIRPHNHFSVQSKRSEVLFVDYIAEHLTPNGRAGIIVPEGIIFQSQNAYKQLRKLLVEDYLVAVVSLPAGVFKPYSGVKTSILILDKVLAKKADRIAFFKVENDGFGLGAQRRVIDKNDLPQVWKELGEYLGRLRAGEAVDGFQLELGLVIEKAKIAAGGEYNLNGERYRKVVDYSAVKWPTVLIGELFESGRGRVISKKYIEENAGEYPVYSSQTQNAGEFGRIKTYDFDGEYITWTTDGANAGTVFYRSGRFNCTNVCGTLKLRKEWKTKAVLQYIAPVLNKIAPKYVVKVGNPKLMNREMERIKIPLPPLEVQREIVAEIEGYQKVIDGARVVVENYRPHIVIDPEWPLVELGEVCLFKRGPFGGSLKKEIFVEDGYAVYEQSHAITGNFSQFRYFIDEEKFAEMSGFQIHPGNLIMSCSGTMGKVAIIPDEARAGVINQALLKLSPTSKIFGLFLKHWMESSNFQQSLSSLTYGSAIKNVASVKALKGLLLPLPSLATQKSIVAEIEAEQALVNANRKLIERFEKKIRAGVGRVWDDS